METAYTKETEKLRWRTGIET